MKFFWDEENGSKRKLNRLFTAKSILNVLRFCMKCEGIYPLRDNSTAAEIILHRFRWWFYVLNDLLVTVVTMHTLYFNMDNFVLTCFLLMEISGLIDTFITLIHFRFNESRMKILLLAARKVFHDKNSSVNLSNRNVYLLSYALMVLLYSPILYLYLMQTKSSNQSILMAARYPFPLDSFILKVVLYFHQLIVLTSTLVSLVSDGVAILLLYMCTLRLKILEMKVKRESLFNNFEDIISEHQEILLLINETNEVVKILVLKDVISYMGFTICTGLVILYFKKMSLKLLLYILLIILIGIKLFICTETGEYLTRAANDLATAVYFSKWYEEKRTNVALKKFLILRCQKESKIYLNGFMSAVNRRYMTSVVYTTYSYFMTIKVIVS